MTLVPGNYVYVDFAVDGEPWHEFCLGPHVIHNFWFVLSPDGDEWVMELGLGDHVRGLRAGHREHRLPRGLGSHVGHPVYCSTQALRRYHVEDFLPTHPGGGKLIEDLLGKPIDEEYEEAEHTKSATRALYDLKVIGKVI